MWSFALALLLAIVPVTERGTQVDDYHGVKVADPYRWLEDLDSPQTQAWVKSQRAYTEGWFAAAPQRGAMLARMKRLWNHDRMPLYGSNAGILVRGETDYVWDRSARCYRVLVCGETECQGEDSTYAFRALERLCRDWSDPRLCGPACGDGFCIGETTASCPADCGPCPGQCGDGKCDPGVKEDCSTCPKDCGACDGCTPKETPGCAGCSCEKCVCAMDPYCCQYAWDDLCVDECKNQCGGCGTQPLCGNGACELGESCSTCPKDCGPCPPTCGNGKCEPEESCATCPNDCGLCCGNGICQVNYGETCQNCPKDCGPCCGNGKCEAALGENCGTCPKDCGSCCGNGICQPALGETCQTCPKDCGPCCGNGKCEPALGESCSTCPKDCGSCAQCGNGKCEAPYETCSSCPADCGPCSCGNGKCEPVLGESCQNCSKDCGSCALMCQPHYTPGCGGCPCESCVCSLWPSCCKNSWTAICVGICRIACGGACP
jgi:hypothetical protein